jgi:hypothetical protein
MPHFFAYSEDRSRDPRPAQLLPCRCDELFRQGRGLYMTSHGKAQKVVNIRRNPKVALMIGPTTPMPRCAGHGARVARSSREPMLFERHFAREAEARGVAPAGPSRIERSRDIAPIESSESSSHCRRKRRQIPIVACEFVRFMMKSRQRHHVTTGQRGGTGIAAFAAPKRAAGAGFLVSKSPSDI